MPRGTINLMPFPTPAVTSILYPSRLLSQFLSFSVSFFLPPSKRYSSKRSNGLHEVSANPRVASVIKGVWGRTKTFNEQPTVKDDHAASLYLYTHSQDYQRYCNLFLLPAPLPSYFAHSVFFFNVANGLFPSSKLGRERQLIEWKKKKTNFHIDACACVCKSSCPRLFS